MARISKSDHQRILQMIDGDQRKVVDVAAEFGCSPAAIYTLLSKLRRDAKPAAEVTGPAPADRAATPALLELFAPQPEPMPPVTAAPARAAAPVPPPAPVPEPEPAPVPERESNVTAMSRQGISKKPGGLGAALAKPGVALVMRTAEGEDTLTPFRSLDDLLSTIKPILRAAARSPDAVWFSIQPVDLASLDSDAA